MAETDLKIIGLMVDGTFSHEEGDQLIFGSHTFPSHRIAVDKRKADQAISDRVRNIINLSIAD